MAISSVIEIERAIAESEARTFEMAKRAVEQNETRFVESIQLLGEYFDNKNDLDRAEWLYHQALDLIKQAPKDQKLEGEVDLHAYGATRQKRQSRQWILERQEKQLPQIALNPANLGNDNPSTPTAARSLISLYAAWKKQPENFLFAKAASGKP